MSLMGDKFVSIAEQLENGSIKTSKEASDKCKSCRNLYIRKINVDNTCEYFCLFDLNDSFQKGGEDCFCYAERGSFLDLPPA